MKTYKVRSQRNDEAAKEKREFVGSKPLHNWGNNSLRGDEMMQVEKERWERKG